MKAKKDSLQEGPVAEGEQRVETRHPNSNPNEVLADEIVAALSLARLIPENRIAELSSKLKIGGVKQEDWGLWVDIASAPHEGDGKAHE